MIRSLREKLQSFWDRPTAALLLFMGVIMTMWTLQCSLLQNILGLDILETVTWGAQMTWGHSKHPPLSAGSAISSPLSPAMRTGVSILPRKPR